MSHHDDWQAEVIAKHDAEKPFAPENGEPLKFKVGDKVTFTNEQGVTFSKTITALYAPKETTALYARGCRYMLDKSAPWMPVREASLSLIEPAPALIPHDVPPLGTRAYTELLRQSIAERDATGDYHRLGRDVRRVLGDDALYGAWAGSGKLQGQVIAETKHSFAVAISPRQAVALHKLDFQQLPAIGMHIEVSAPDERGRRSIALSKPTSSTAPLRAKRRTALTP